MVKESTAIGKEMILDSSAYFLTIGALVTTGTTTFTPVKVIWESA